MSNENQIQWLLNAATVVFKPHSDSARLDAELLLCHVLDCDRTYLFTWSDKVVNEQDVVHFNQLVKRREKGEPIAHITGFREFWSLNFEVSPATLIPRPDTEVLVESALDYALARLSEVSNELSTNAHTSHQFKGLDLGTGTGAIALSLASELPNWHWLAVDLIDDAVALAKRNATLNDITNCDITQSSWFENIPAQQFDLIVSNPPYIDPVDEHLTQGDVRFEPLSALVADEQGLSDIKIIIDNARGFLRIGAPLFLEHGFDQAEAVKALFLQFGFQNVSTIKDLSGKNRVTVGYFL